MYQKITDEYLPQSLHVFTFMLVLWDVLLRPHPHLLQYDRAAGWRMGVT